MEFMSRGRGDAPASSQPGAAGPAQARRGRAGHIDWETRSVRIELFILTLGCALILAVVILWAIFAGNVGYNEGNQVDKSKYQAVFLNGGATSGSVAYTTYFGHVTTLNDKYMVLKDVYYLTTDNTSTSSSANPQLTKLGCQQLHSPYDEMVINRNQVAFWENLQSTGKVVQAIQQFQKQNPNGPNCNQASNSTGSNSSTQNSTTPSTNTGTNNGTGTTGTKQ
ncbi:MAG TPA: hypothetical protein VG964_00910 [Candidatus Saccharimonadales bacterium]|nr:hypothetical protein [Candidatus Saccharimonadales bacterium]